MESEFSGKYTRYPHTNGVVVKLWSARGSEDKFVYRQPQKSFTFFFSFILGLSIGSASIAVHFLMREE
jgi:hypothetical protein